MMMKVDILGAVYKVHIVNKFPKRMAQYEGEAGGLCNRHNRQIYIKREACADTTAEGLERCVKETLRHELLHAYLSESGLSANALQYDDSWAENEEMVDWLAIQMPKIFKTFQEVDCL
ncbi:MAG: hypothetical protein RSC76_00075 [Oscillospiraceae bacterium]